MSTEAQFDAVFRAFANLNRQARYAAEQLEKINRDRHRKDLKHIKALAKRRKRKRGGPK